MNFIKSSIGQKVLMALTGLGLIGFLIAHMTGNLLVFKGPDGINEYAHWLHSKSGLLWTARIGLIAMFIIHVATAVSLTCKNLAARPVAYKAKNVLKATVTSLTMRLSGVIVLLYVVGHLLHFTWGKLLPENAVLIDAAGRKDVYAMVVLGFEHPLVSWAYIVSMILLGMHLKHGIQSVFQTLGINHPKYNPLIARGSLLLTVMIILGYISIPLAVVAGKLTVPFVGFGG